MIARNRDALGVPGLQIVAGEAPGALAGLEAPDAIFIGGGVTDEGVLQACWDALKPGGRLVANAVTLQSEMQLFAWRQRFGGELIRLSVAQAAGLGSFDVWRQALPVTLYSARKDK
jgi:precorrin-6Y C5,15-methyltransferase (decarboxylating)